MVAVSVCVTVVTVGGERLLVREKLAAASGTNAAPIVCLPELTLISDRLHDRLTRRERLSQ